MAAVVTVFTSLGCGHCHAAVALLRQHAIRFTEVKLDAHHGVRDQLFARTGVKTVPQVFFGNKFIGGRSELDALHSAGRLLPVVAELLAVTRSGSSATAHTDASAHGDAGGPSAAATAATSVTPRRSTPLLDAVPCGSPAGFVPPDGPPLEALTHPTKPPTLPPISSAAAPRTTAPSPAPAATAAADAAAVRQQEELVRLDAIGRRLLDPATGPKIGRHRRLLLFAHRNCVSGSELVSWCASHLSLSRVAATAMCRRVMHRGWFSPVQLLEDFEDSGTLYRFQEHRAAAPQLQPNVPLSPPPEHSRAAFDSGRPSAHDGQAGWRPRHPPPNGPSSPTLDLLNTAFVFHGIARPAPVVADNLRRSVLTLYDRYLFADGRAVDYAALSHSKEFATFVRSSAELQVVDLTTFLGHANAAKAFFINLYNIMVVHSITMYGPPKTNWQRLRFYDKVAYRIGPWRWTLNDIEHGVLRGNRLAPLHFRRPFSDDDPRRQFMLQCDPRIHFALVCGARSCPPIALYSGDTLQRDLDTVTHAFLNDASNLQLDVRGRCANMSRIMHWYGVDFGGNVHDILRWCLQYLTPSNRATAEALLQQPSIEKKFFEYNWALNDGQAQAAPTSKAPTTPVRRAGSDGRLTHVAPPSPGAHGADLDDVHVAADSRVGVVAGAGAGAGAGASPPRVPLVRGGKGGAELGDDYGDGVIPGLVGDTGSGGSSSADTGDVRFWRLA